MTTTTLILGLIAATLLLIGGCGGFVFGTFATAVEESFEIEDDGDGVTSEEVSSAGASAILVAIFLYVAAGISKVAHRTSLVLLLLTMPMLIGLIVTDWSSVFAATYYLGFLLTGVCCILMFIAWRKSAAEPIGSTDP